MPSEESITGPCQATTMAARKAVLCRLINEPMKSKSTAMDASIITIIYCHLLCVNCLLGAGPVGSADQGEKSSVVLKRENWSCETYREDERNIKIETFHM